MSSAPAAPSVTPVDDITIAKDAFINAQALIKYISENQLSDKLKNSNIDIIGQYITKGLELLKVHIPLNDTQREAIKTALIKYVDSTMNNSDLILLNNEIKVAIGVDITTTFTPDNISLIQTKFPNTIIVWDDSKIINVLQRNPTELKKILGGRNKKSSKDNKDKDRKKVRGGSVPDYINNVAAFQNVGGLLATASPLDNAVNGVGALPYPGSFNAGLNVPTSGAGLPNLYNLVIGPQTAGLSAQSGGKSKNNRNKDNNKDNDNKKEKKGGDNRNKDNDNKKDKKNRK